MIGGIGALLGVAALAAWLLIVALKRLPQRGATWRFGLANLRRRPLASSLQVGALALGFMALLLLTVVRGDLMQNWRASLPADAPNHFVLNVLPDQVDGVRAALDVDTRRRDASLPDDSRPSGRGERRAARHRAVRRHALAPAGRARVQSLVCFRVAQDQSHRERQVVRRRHRTGGGHLDGEGHRGVVASEARRLAHVRHRRHAGHGDDPQPAQGRLGQLPAELLHAVRARRARIDAADLSRRGALARRSAVGGMALGAGAAVSRTCSRSTSARSSGRCRRSSGRWRRRSSSCSCSRCSAASSCCRRRSPPRRTSAASTRRSCARSARRARSSPPRRSRSSSCSGALAGALGAAGATALGYVLSDRVFQIPFSANPMVWLYGVVGGAAVVTLAGWLGTRGTMRQPPLAVIRQLG